MDDYQLVIPVKLDFSTDLAPSEMIGSNWIMLDKILGRSALYIRPKTKINEVLYPIIWNHCKDQIVLRTMTHPGLEMIWLFFS
jgi:hypothetical protein